MPDAVEPSLRWLIDARTHVRPIVTPLPDDVERDPELVRRSRDADPGPRLRWCPMGMSILIAFAAPALAATPAWGSCPDNDDLATCRTLQVPRDHADSDGPTWDLVLKRVPPASGTERGQLWHITGGPGDSGLNALGNLDAFAERYAPNYALMSLDVRGVGFSDRLSCDAEESPSSDEGRALTRDEWRSCAAQLADRPAADLASFTTTQTARDVIQAIEATRADGPVVVWGVSYGTFLVDRMIALEPEVADAVILDGVVPPDWTFLEFDAGLDQVTRAYAARCADDPACAELLGPDPVGFAEQLLADLEDGHCSRLGLDAPLTRLVEGVFMMGAETTADQLPVVWHRLRRCKSRDVRAFVNLFDTLFPEEGDQEDPTHAPVLQRHIAYTDLWGPTPPPSELQATVSGAIATTEVTVSFGDVADAWVPTDPGPAHRAPPVTDVPMLVLHGGFDPTMPLARARDRATFLTGEHQRFIEVPEAYHVTLNQGDCPASLYEQFLADPTGPLDVSCVAEMPRLGFGADPDRDAELWGDEDRWGASGCATTGLRPVGGLLLCLLVLRQRRSQHRS